jgi:carbonic anhydrase
LAACNTQAGICTLRFSSCSAIQIAALSPQRSIRACAAHDSFREFRSSSIPFLAGLADLDSQLSPEAMLTQAVEANVRWSMRQILETPEGGERQAEGRMELVGAIYEIETGGFGFWSESGSIRCSCALPLEAQMTDADGRVFGIR